MGQGLLRGDKRASKVGERQDVSTAELACNLSLHMAEVGLTGSNCLQQAPAYTRYFWPTEKEDVG